MLEFLWAVEIRPSSHNILTANMDEKDRPSDVALLNGMHAPDKKKNVQDKINISIFFSLSFETDGRLVVCVETSPDSREAVSPQKTFVQVY